MTADSKSRGTPSTELTITRIETFPIRVPLGRVYRGSKYRMTHRSTIVTRLHTEEGVIGEAYVGDEDDGLEEIDRIIHTEIAPLLIGQDATSTERCWEIVRPVTMNILRDRRLGLVAAACVDTAIWDALGKHLGQPLWRLWGGYTNTLPITIAGGYYFPDADIAADVLAIRDLQFAGMKFKVGGLSPELDAARFKQARKAAGPDFVLMADANQGWTPQEAIRFARLVQDDDLYWFEEPCHWDNDRRAMRDVRYRGGSSICAGQTEFSAGGCRDLMETGAIDFCNFDASWSGGPTEWRRVAATARAYNVAMAHHEEFQVAAHLLASIPHGTFVETFMPDRDPIWWNIMSNRPEVKDGYITLSDAPGLGWELDWDFIEHHLVKYTHELPVE